ncbi:hypothetical protein JXR74_09515 [Candidatus Mcinerneyibacteriota bacterium]|nr:hypothetical protein [Candidatus Mcinerneyibacteriota bacterium]
MKSIFTWIRLFVQKGPLFGIMAVLFLTGCSFPGTGRRLYPDCFDTIRVSRLTELSGMALSACFPGVIWGINDSGHLPELFAMDREGNPAKPFSIKLSGRKNRDWEDMASDGKGRLFIADTGNNLNRRRDLGILIIDEHELDAGTRTVSSHIIPLEYPGQREFPPPLKKRNFDCEALCYIRGTLCLFTKNRGNKETDLYTLDEENEFSGPLAYRESFPVEGLVTGADFHPAGFLALLTYSEILIFDVSEKITLQKPVKRFFLDTLQVKQCESILFIRKGLLVSNEQGDLYFFSFEQLGLSL